MKQGSTVTYLHSDHLGSTSVASTQDGAFLSRQTYFAFGVPRTSEGNAFPTDYTFTGQKFDASDGLMYYDARYYDAALGRFISADTIVPSAANPQSLNRYAYVLNNPLKYRDPSGHMQVCDDFGSGCGKEGTGETLLSQIGGGCRSDVACSGGYDPANTTSTSAPNGTPTVPNGVPTPLLPMGTPAASITPGPTNPAKLLATGTSKWYYGKVPDVDIQRLRGWIRPDKLQSGWIVVGPLTEWVVPPERAAITIDNTIFVKQQYFEPGTIDWEVLLSHESTHIEQYQRDGFAVFVETYIIEWLTKGERKVHYEQEAYDAGDAIRLILYATHR